MRLILVPHLRIVDLACGDVVFPVLCQALEERSLPSTTAACKNDLPQPLKLYAYMSSKSSVSVLLLLLADDSLGEVVVVSSSASKVLTSFFGVALALALDLAFGSFFFGGALFLAVAARAIIDDKQRATKVGCQACRPLKAQRRANTAEKIVWRATLAGDIGLKASGRKSGNSDDERQSDNCIQWTRTNEQFISIQIKIVFSKTTSTSNDK